MTTFDLNETLKTAGWKEDSIKRIYHGGDHVCRCGCAGKYFKRGTIGFSRAMRKLREGFLTESAGDEVYVTGYGRDQFQISKGVEISNIGFINVPIADDPRHNKCYCLYSEA